MLQIKVANNKNKKYNMLIKLQLLNINCCKKLQFVATKRDKFKYVFNISNKMVKYECDICNYTTINKANYAKHNNTKKHIEKSNNDETNKKNISKGLSKDSQKTPKTIKKIDDHDENYMCQYCNRYFTRSNNLGRHIKKCEAKLIQINDKDLKIKEYEKELKYEKELAKRDKELYDKEVKRNEYQQKEIEYYKEALAAAGSMLQTTVSALTYANNNYDDAPVIKKIQIDQIKQIKNYDDDVYISEVFSAHKNKTIGKYLGDVIVKLYKKEDPSKQSIWNTDTHRFTYMLKKFIHTEKSMWMVDKKGVDMVDNIVTPITDDIRKLAIKYRDENNFDNCDGEKVMLINSIFVSLIADIDNKKVQNEILKYTSSHFFMKNKKTIKNEE